MLPFDCLCFQLRLEALHQILVLLSGMEEKGSVPLMGSHQGTGFQSSSLLTSVRLQFLAGCFGLGTVGHAGAKGESVRLHHYQVCILVGFFAVSVDDKNVISAYSIYLFDSGWYQSS